jgi:glycerophosphoryl diester phosphodiesterase
MGYAPENTIESYERAIALGCDEIETDVWLHGGRLLVSHDQPTPDTLLTLDEALETCRGRATLNVELKAQRDAEAARETGRHAARLIAERATDAYVSSFWWPALDGARKAAPAVRRAFIYSAYFEVDVLVDRAVRAGLWALHPRHDYVTVELVRAAHAAGLQVNCWTVNDEDIAALIALGVDGIASDFPDRVPKG